MFHLLQESVALLGISKSVLLLFSLAAGACWLTTFRHRRGPHWLIRHSVWLPAGLAALLAMREFRETERIIGLLDQCQALSVGQRDLLREDMLRSVTSTLGLGAVLGGGLWGLSAIQKRRSSATPSREEDADQTEPEVSAANPRQ